MASYHRRHQTQLTGYPYNNDFESILASMLASMVANYRIRTTNKSSNSTSPTHNYMITIKQANTQAKASDKYTFRTHYTSTHQELATDEKNEHVLKRKKEKRL